MDTFKRPALATPPTTPAKADAPKLRRKLQKISKQSRNQPTQQLSSGTSNESLDKNVNGSSKLDGGRVQPVSQTKSHGIAQSPTQSKGEQPCLPLPPDLSDTKWLEYLRRSGIIYALDGSPESNDHRSIPVSVIPELAHLKSNEAKPQPSVDRMAPPAAMSNPSTAASTRRRAKTPVLRIGQLEGFSQNQTAPAIPPPRQVHQQLQPLPPPKHSSRKADPNLSVELLAEQYRALLRPSSESMFADAYPEQPKQRHHAQNDVVEIRRNSADSLHASSPDMSLANCSPISDTTIVAFDDETVYFKPVSFSPELPSSPSPGRQGDISPALSSDWSPPDNLSLQICLDLLTKELLSATTDRSRRLGSEISALQVWVMIETYERLRDRIVGGDGSRLLNAQRGSVELMLDMWLRALYTMHDSLAGEARSISSESDYDNLESPALD